MIRGIKNEWIYYHLFKIQGDTFVEVQRVILTKDLLDEILYFYREEIDNYKNSIAKNKEDIVKLEVRISKANVNLYDRISKEIDECYERIDFEEKEIEHYQYLYDKFAFCSSIINNESNSEYYELIYTKS